MTDIPAHTTAAATDTPDTRNLFWPLCIRKPGQWEECPRRSASELSRLQRELLRNLPTFSTDTEWPLDDFLGEQPPLECLVLHKGKHLYYVNTEGYRYARYAFRIDLPNAQTL